MRWNRLRRRLQFPPILRDSRGIHMAPSRRDQLIHFAPAFRLAAAILPLVHELDETVPPAVVDAARHGQPPAAARARRDPALPIGLRNGTPSNCARTSRAKCTRMPQDCGVLRLDHSRNLARKASYASKLPNSAAKRSTVSRSAICPRISQRVSRHNVSTRLSGSASSSAGWLAGCGSHSASSEGAVKSSEGSLVIDAGPNDPPKDPPNAPSFPQFSTGLSTEFGEFSKDPPNSSVSLSKLMTSATSRHSTR